MTLSLFRHKVILIRRLISDENTFLTDGLLPCVTISIRAKTRRRDNRNNRPPVDTCKQVFRFSPREKDRVPDPPPPPPCVLACQLLRGYMARRMLI